jgi:hypothetical protein
MADPEPREEISSSQGEVLSGEREYLRLEEEGAGERTALPSDSAYGRNT